MKTTPKNLARLETQWESEARDRREKFNQACAKVVQAHTLLEEANNLLKPYHVSYAFLPYKINRVLELFNQEVLNRGNNTP